MAIVVPWVVMFESKRLTRAFGEPQQLTGVDRDFLPRDETSIQMLMWVMHPSYRATFRAHSGFLALPHLIVKSIVLGVGSFAWDITTGQDFAI